MGLYTPAKPKLTSKYGVVFGIVKMPAVDWIEIVREVKFAIRFSSPVTRRRWSQRLQLSHGDVFFVARSYVNRIQDLQENGM